MAKKLELDHLIKRTKELSSLPAIVARLQAATVNPDAKILEIAEIVKEDAALTTRLLRVVNSVFYSFEDRVETVSRAIVAVGMRELQELTLATTVIDTFRDVSTTLVNMESFWRHSLAVGQGARLIGQRLGIPNTERLFVAGLLHDIGSVVLYKQAPQQSQQALAMAANENMAVWQAERAVFGFDHADVGRALLARWKLSLDHQAAVSYHHRPKAATFAKFEATVVHLADMIANAMQYGSSGESRVPPLDVRAWAELELEPVVIEDILDELNDIYDDVTEAMLGATD